MEYYDMWKRNTENIEAVYTSSVTKDGVLTLPEECLTGMDGLSFVLTNYLIEGILSLYTEDAFNDIKERLERSNMLDPTIRMIRRLVIGEAIEITMNKNGRINIGPEFRLRLGLGEDRDSVRLLKYPDKIEIMAEELYHCMHMAQK